MIIMLIGLVGSAVYGWWPHRKAAAGKAVFPKA